MQKSAESPTFSVRKTVILAAGSLEDEGRKPFPYEDLAVRAWQENPELLGLKGHKDKYPDSSKLGPEIMGKKGLVKRGLFLQRGEKLYELTDEGWEECWRLRTLRRETREEVQGALAPESTETPAEENPFGDEEERLLYLLVSDASDYFLEGRKEEITFPHACKFWRLDEQTSGDAVDAHFQQFGAFLDILEKRMPPTGATLRNHRYVSWEDVNLLRRVHRYLLERFQRHIMLLRRRERRV